MGDLIVRCVPVDSMEPAQPPCPEGYTLSLTDAPPPIFLSAGELEIPVAIGAAAILIPWLIGVAYRTVCDFLES